MIVGILGGGAWGRALATLTAEAGHEPRIALTPGPTGLEALEVLAGQGASFLAPGGYMICEIGHDQGESVLRLFGDVGGWSDARVLRDRFSGQQRVFEARRVS